MTEGDGRLANHMRHVGAVDEEDLVVAFDHNGDLAQIHGIWRSALVGERSICHWCKLSLSSTSGAPSLGKTRE